VRAKYEIKPTWKGAVMASCKILSWLVGGETEEILLKQWMSQPTRIVESNEDLLNKKQ
jgi:hypothetical protein